MCKRSFKVIVVSDSGPLIALAKIGQLDLLLLHMVRFSFLKPFTRKW
jgi:hypothetical protein